MKTNIFNPDNTEGFPDMPLEGIETRELNVKKNWPVFYEYLVKNIQGSTWPQKLYNYTHSQKNPRSAKIY